MVKVILIHSVAPERLEVFIRKREVVEYHVRHQDKKQKEKQVIEAARLLTLARTFKDAGAIRECAILLEVAVNELDGHVSGIGDPQLFLAIEKVIEQEEAGLTVSEKNLLHFVSLNDTNPNLRFFKEEDQERLFAVFLQIVRGPSRGILEALVSGAIETLNERRVFYTKEKAPRVAEYYDLAAAPLRRLLGYLLTNVS